MKNLILDIIFTILRHMDLNGVRDDLYKIYETKLNTEKEELSN